MAGTSLDSRERRNPSTNRRPRLQRGAYGKLEHRIELLFRGFLAVPDVHSGRVRERERMSR